MQADLNKKMADLEMGRHRSDCMDVLADLCLQIFNRSCYACSALHAFWFCVVSKGHNPIVSESSVTFLVHGSYGFRVARRDGTRKRQIN